ncbi:phytoene desaturase family protein [Shouchella shacheensis]|uniref:phytoene desaturase family protein n=1 Tax=Shouchella shacheensis TaxID=1649580 RepID=UPI00073FAA19|nr:phytoene desaturase family protein [Shouchella shacheensis]
MFLKKIIVIGAGPGGLASAMLLAGRGYEVTVLEKQPFLGGRTSLFEQDGFSFDRGPTFFSMPHILEELFEAVGRKLSDYLTMHKVDPMYELRFEDIAFSPSYDTSATYERIEESFPGNGRGFLRFLEETEQKMAALMPVLQNRHGSLFDYGRWRTLKALPKLSLGRSLYDELSRYFTDERLKLSFTFQSKYLGMSPWECPAAFSILSYMEYAYGIFHPEGGVNQIPQAMAKVCQEFGAKIHTHTDVKKILTKNKDVYGVELANGEELYCDELIVNADFAYTMSELIDEANLKKYKPHKLKKKKYSCSTFMIYANVDKEYELPHHTVIFSKDYKKNVEEVTGSKLLSADPSIYVHNPIGTDRSLAPPGKSPIYLLAPVPNNFSGIDWRKEQSSTRDLIYQQVEERTGFKGLRDHVTTETILTPADWEASFNVYKGATFNLAHNLGQMMYFRPHNRFEELGSCWLVGGGTHPGSGLPTILESGRITAQSLMESDKEITIVR